MLAETAPFGLAALADCARVYRVCLTGGIGQTPIRNFGADLTLINPITDITETPIAAELTSRKSSPSIKLTGVHHDWNRSLGTRILP
jgi:hypothetical protein